MAEAESNLAAAQEIMGHSDIQTTRKCTHPTRKQKADAVDNEKGRVEPARNPFTPEKVLTMSPE